MVRDRQHGPLLELNRFGVKSKRTKNNSGGGRGKEESTRSLFAQMVNKAASLNSDSLLLPHQVWKVKFVGESVDDCGGGTLRASPVWRTHL